MKKSLIFLIAFFLIGVWCVGVAVAVTDAEKQVAIDKGLAYLASTQNADGSWSYGGYEPAATAAVLLSFVDQSYKPIGWNGVDYSTVVTKATSYVLKDAQTYTFAAGGNWSGFGAGSSGITMAAMNNEVTYTTGLTIPALSRLVSNPYGGSPIYSPSAVISSTNPVVNGQTYAQVIQKMVDSFTYGQTGPAAGNQYGGWRYFPGQNQSDMSTTQWAPISYLFAGQVPGVTVPTVGDTTTTALKAWLTADQYANGGVDYSPNSGIVNATHAGGFIVSNYFAGGGGNLAKAVEWLNGDWLSTPSGTWYGNVGNPYAMWAVYKGLETVYGTTGAGPISNLHTQTTLLDSGDVWNWWEDYCQYLVGAQNINGSWSGYDYWTGPLATAWDINILNATATAPPRVPEPATLLLLGLGLVGIGAVRRKFRK